MATSDKERRHYVDAFHVSGLTPVLFCTRNNLKIKTFYVWLKRYAGDFEKARRSEPSKPFDFEAASFLPLQVAEDIKREEFSPEDVIKQTIPLSFKTKNFCLELPLNIQENFADFRLLLKAFHELV